MRKLLTFVLLVLWMGFSYPLTIREMRFENVKLETVLKALSEVSGMNVIFDPAISQDLQKTVSVAIYRPVPVGEAMNIVLKTHGLIAVPVDRKVFKITRAGDVTFDIAGYTDAQVKELINLLKARVSPSAEIVIDRTLKKVFVRDELSRIEQLKRLQRDIEKASLRVEADEEVVTKVFYIRRDVPYRDVSKALRELNIKDMTITEAPEFNALIVSARKGDIQRIEKAIERYTRDIKTEKPILTKTLYVKYIPAEEFRRLIQPMLSEIGEVYVLGAGIYTTAAEERELREIQQRIQTIAERMREASPEEREILQRQLQQLQQRQQQLQNIMQAPQGQKGDSVSITGFPLAREGILGPEFKKERSARVAFQNAVIVRDYADVVYRIIERYRDIVSEQPVQIKIEARIVEMSSMAVRELGINWNTLLSQARVPQFWSGGGGANLGIGSSPSPNPGLSATPGGILAFTLQRGVLNALNLRLSAYEQVHKAKTLSKPVILTLNGEPAVIQSLIEFPIFRRTLVQGAGEQVTVEYKNIPVNLTVVPVLLPEGNIMLDITIVKADIIREREQAGSIAPIIQSQRADAKVIVKDGDVVVLGGIVKSVDRKEERGVPGLIRVPLLRWLFMEQKIEKEDAELLIFIQPTLISQ